MTRLQLTQSMHVVTQQGQNISAKRGSLGTAAAGLTFTAIAHIGTYTCIGAASGDVFIMQGPTNTHRVLKPNKTGSAVMALHVWTKGSSLDAQQMLICGGKIFVDGVFDSSFKVVR